MTAVLEPVKYRIDSFDFNGVISEEFRQKLESLDLDIVSMLLLKENKSESGKVVGLTFISMSYEKNADLTQKILHVESSDSKLLEKFINAIDKKEV